MATLTMMLSSGGDWLGCLSMGRGRSDCCRARRPGDLATLLALIELVRSSAREASTAGTPRICSPRRIDRAAPATESPIVGSSVLRCATSQKKDVSRGSLDRADGQLMIRLAGGDESDNESR